MTIEICYYAASSDDMGLCASVIREHGKSSHWHCDFSFEEYDNKTINSNAFENLSLFFTMILSLLKILQATPAYKGKSINTMRKMFGWNPEDNLKQLFCIIDRDTMDRAITDELLSKTEKGHANKILKDMT